MSLATQFADSLHRAVGKGFAKLFLESGEAYNTAASDYYALVAFRVQTMMNHLPSQCSVAASVLWCDWEWWQFRQAVGTHLDPTCTDSHWRNDRTGPHLRWENVFVKTFGDHWKREAASTQWKQQRGAFRFKAYQLFQSKPFEDRFATSSKSIADQPLVKKVRIVYRTPVLWSFAVGGARRFEVLRDSSLVINWVNG